MANDLPRTQINRSAVVLKFCFDLPDKGVRFFHLSLIVSRFTVNAGGCKCFFEPKRRNALSKQIK